MENTQTAHSFSFTTIDGQELPLAKFKDKLVLMVNTASKCGFTSQYFTLEALWKKYKNQGLVVIAASSNDFGGQEPLNEEEIKSFCLNKYNVSFYLTKKIKVRGSDAHPFYQWAANELGFLASPKWNFHKYLIGPNGNLVNWFSSITEPMEASIVNSIEENLKLLPNKQKILE